MRPESDGEERETAMPGNGQDGDKGRTAPLTKKGKERREDEKAAKIMQNRKAQGPTFEIGRAHV